MDARAITELKDLARRDAELSAEAGRLRELDRQVTMLRARAEAIDAFFVVYAQEETRRRALANAAEDDLARRRDELAEAERELSSARDDEARERAQSVAIRARDHVAVAEAARGRAQADAQELERDASSFTAEVKRLEARARAAVEEGAHLPPPPHGVRELVEWASHAHAELFVAAGQLDTHRERVIREANELATMLLGEPTYGSAVAQLLHRVDPENGVT